MWLVFVKFWFGLYVVLCGVVIFVAVDVDVTALF